jgi:hypothetical protein
LYYKKIRIFDQLGQTKFSSNLKYKNVIRTHEKRQDKNEIRNEGGLDLISKMKKE